MINKIDKTCATVPEKRAAGYCWSVALVRVLSVRWLASNKWTDTKVHTYVHE